MEYRDSARVRELLAQGVLLFDGARARRSVRRAERAKL